MELQFQCFCIFVINSVFNAPLAAYIVNSGSCGKNHVDAPESATQLYFWQTYYGGLALKCTVSLACFSSPHHQKYIYIYIYIYKIIIRKKSRTRIGFKDIE